MVEHHPVIFTPEARRLVSAEGGMGGVLVIAVGPDPPGLDRAAQTVGGVAAPGPDARAKTVGGVVGKRSEEHTSELQSLMRNSYAVFCLKKNKQTRTQLQHTVQLDNHITIHT